MSDPLVTLFERTSNEEAHIVKNLLEAEGIEVFLEGELASGVFWGASPNIGNTKVKVKAADYERAFAIVQDDSPSDEEAVDEAESPPEVGEAEEGPGETPLDQMALRSFKAAVCGWFFFPLTFYSVYLIVRVIFDDGEMKKRGIGIVWTAVGINLATLFFYLFLYFSLR